MRTFPGAVAALLGLSLLLVLPALAAVAPPPSVAAAAAASSSGSSTNSSGLSEPPAANRSEGAQRSPMWALLRDLPALKAAVIGACAASVGLIACLLLRVLRSGRKIKKTRKYDIITTPAERVEMAPLNEDDEDDEDSTVFDIKYRPKKSSGELEKLLTTL
ncbi:membrane protein FAM174B [Podarcis raffonei]|uniref:membrane protein FAM174B n=1 Tax=Podarcis raffonei TaxID=65483 RepID=UPI0023294501|nr:membrane protein FAM174B [Podarcis raffonei]